MGLFEKIFGTYSEKEVKRVRPIVDKINGLEEEQDTIKGDFIINPLDTLNLISYEVYPQTLPNDSKTSITI